MVEIREGGCLCGTVRYRVKEIPCEPRCATVHSVSAVPATPERAARYIKHGEQIERDRHEDY